MQQIFHHYSVFNLSLNKQNNAADWMADADVPIVFPGGKKKIIETRKEQTKPFFLQLSSAWAVSKKYKHEPVHTATICLLRGEGPL